MSEPPVEKVKLFGLAHCLYAITLLTSVIVTFGAEGIVPGVVILFAWGLVFCSRSRPAALCNVCAVILIGLCLSSLLFPAVQSAREAAPRSQCLNNLKQIGLALYNYHDMYGSFPPAYVADEKGRPMHSWRVWMLPQLDRAALFRAYDFDEPWDGPNNSQLRNIVPVVFRCPVEEFEPETENAALQTTNYVAVVGPRTVFPGTGSVSAEDISDGPGSVIAIVEVTNSGIHWMEPRDLSLNEALDLFASTAPQLAGGHRSEDFFCEYYVGRHIMAADSRVYFVPHGVDREVWRALLTIDDGGDLDDLLASSQSAGTRKYKLGNCCRFAIFVFLVLFPLPWVWLNPTSAVGGRSEKHQVSGGE